MNAPTLFVLAADLTKMQVVAAIDESDVGRMRPGQHVTFQVDAYPNDRFTGTVSQIRLQPAVVQNVVTYSTVITVPNPELKLKPGMTANVTVEVIRRTNVLRVANAATRFRPTEEMFAVLNQAIPADLQRTRGTGARGARPGNPAAQAGSAAGAQGAAATTGTTPPSRTLTSGATTIDALFAPVATAETRGAVWQYGTDHQLKMIRLRLGATDGTFTEVLNEADVPADAVMVTAMKTGPGAEEQRHRGVIVSDQQPAAGRRSAWGAGGTRRAGGEATQPLGLAIGAIRQARDYRRARRPGEKYLVFLLSSWPSC